MGTILFTWELGAGLGHVMTMAPLVRAMKLRGHRVVVVGKDVRSAHRVFGEAGAELLGTPRSAVTPPFPRQFTYAHLLANVGFADAAMLESHCAAWRNIFAMVRPDVIVFNHSPMALLAARGVSARRVLIGSGFFIVPDVAPLPAFRPDLPLDLNSIRAVEEQILAKVNAILNGLQQSQLNRLGQIYAEVDLTMLMTYPELDHFPDRKSPEYFGCINDGAVGGRKPVWPEVAGKKIYGYLRNFQSLPQLLTVLNESKQPTLIFGEGIDPPIRTHFSSNTLRFETERLNIDEAATSCDIAITHAGLSTTAMLLRAGKPCLMVPMQEEQGMLARRVHQYGAGLGVFIDQPEPYAERLKLLLEDARFKTAAGQLAVKLSRVDLAERRQVMVERVAALI